MNILSVSRRTDIPTFYADWFRERLLEGVVRVYNPDCGGMVTVPLDETSVDRFVFWSRYYRPFLKHCLPALKERNAKCQFHFTITGLPKTFDRNSPLVDEAITSFKSLVKETDPSSVYWRFDPIVITNATPVAYVIDSFKYIAEKLKGFTNLCLTSFVKLDERIKGRLPSSLVDITRKERIELLKQLNGIAYNNSMQFRMCQLEEAVPGVIGAAVCEEGGDLHKLADGQLTHEKCACLATLDIGSYDSCAAGCVYCFANTNFENSINRRRVHLPVDEGLPLPVRLLKKQTPKLDPALQGLHRAFASCKPCPVVCDKRIVEAVN